MRIISFRKTKVPMTIGFLAFFAALAVLININSGVSVAKTANSTLYESGSAKPGVAASAKPVIVIDAGHGGADSGCVGATGTLEKNVNLAIAGDIAEMLRFAGYEVVMTRDSDVSIHDKGTEGLRNQKVSDMKNRRAVVDKYPNGLFISIHQNQFTAPEYFGAQMFYSVANPDNSRLADIMQGKFRLLQPENLRETKLIDNGLYLFKETKQPSLLIECGFLSNPDDEAKLNSRDYQKEVALTIFSGINEFFNN